MRNFIKENTGLIIRFDDIAENMNWKTFNIIEKTLNELNIKPVLGVIPLNKDPELLMYEEIQENFWDKIRKWNKNGWEIAMHGTYHLYDKIVKKKKEIGKLYYKLLKNNKNIYIQRPSYKNFENIYWIVGLVIRDKKIMIILIMVEIQNFAVILLMLKTIKLKLALINLNQKIFLLDVFLLPIILLI